MTQYSKKGNGTGLPSGPEPCLYHHPLHPTNAFLVQFSVHTAHKSGFLHLLYFFFTPEIQIALKDWICPPAYRGRQN